VIIKIIVQTIYDIKYRVGKELENVEDEE